LTADVDSRRVVRFWSGQVSPAFTTFGHEPPAGAAHSMRASSTFRPSRFPQSSWRNMAGSSSPLDLPTPQAVGRASSAEAKHDPQLLRRGLCRLQRWRLRLSHCREGDWAEGPAGPDAIRVGGDDHGLSSKPCHSHRRSESSTISATTLTLSDQSSVYATGAPKASPNFSRARAVSPPKPSTMPMARSPSRGMV